MKDLNNTMLNTIKEAQQKHCSEANRKKEIITENTQDLMKQKKILKQKFKKK